MINVSDVSKSVSNYAPSLDEKTHNDFTHHIWEQVKDDDVYDVNLANEWQAFKNKTHAFYREW